ncbi:bifunctional phosphoribosyl-AMP cyclohydrolase/phosphoribosyl-ATP diphosphatase HisIE [Candidatus Blochmannia ocreatus (nom. nud.)]|uniref:Histidine biosynthesis bifunctional protein HisIE n=1 Tax=Candidatus Blochmannia ocreatus (nom. nud.) TaxID=251538 RepID=A0ABY4SSK3_9ENTR|nr:bifunctional phosphoribosyl-AMP cyclohydrolase/phosphoribosyl-ATP diphosphatase HisIE [Candidatus Blochmannia ocreatus]URJ24962.1 bifunctional phosphoribosyl-AMP cyclohydrolase/phosphoribosyl-ATP diphosphatase HisIE [Candidatus Blochmannia ocreatus]
MLINTQLHQNKINWTKTNNNKLIPAIIQHATSGEVLMLGYMNEASIIQTEKTRKVTFFSRSKNRLWTKGEQSGNILQLIDWYLDCDNDSLLILALPHGPTCHFHTNSCFHPAITTFSFLYQLEHFLSLKKNISHQLGNTQSSYTAKLYSQGIKRIAQKVGEEGIETALAAVTHNNNKTEIINEAADLIYHLLVLLQHTSLTFSVVLQELQKRHYNNQKKSTTHKSHDK